MTEKKRQAEVNAIELTDDELEQTQGGVIIGNNFEDFTRGRKPKPSTSTRLVGTATANPDGN